MKALLVLGIVFALVFAGCAGSPQVPPEQQVQKSDDSGKKEIEIEKEFEGEEEETIPPMPPAANNSTQPPAMPANNSTQVPPAPEPSGITASELAVHKFQSDCWVSYKGEVYDLTAWLPKHPGSAGAIAPYCGTSGEFEAAFTGKHGTFQVEKMKQESVLKGSFAG